MSEGLSIDFLAPTDRFPVHAALPGLGAIRVQLPTDSPRREVGEARRLTPELAALVARLAGDGRPLRVFCCGIGGSGVSGLARMLKLAGHEVRGSDRQATPATDELSALGIPVAVPQSAENLADEPVDLFIRSAAVPDDHPEVGVARARGAVDAKYARALGLVMEGKRGVAIAGTHGKTTTTAMTSLILDEAGVDPSVVVGGRVAALGGSARAGRGPHLVVEACEFDRSFLELCPQVAVVTNIEEDHLDYYQGGLPEIVGTFGDFLDLLPVGGAAVINGDDPNVRRAARRARADGVQQVSFGLGEGCDFRAIDVRVEGGRPAFLLQSVAHGHRPPVPVHLGVPGLHNVRNALSAAAAAFCAAGVAPDVSARALERFVGVDRRFQVLHESPELAVVDDYAHHPTAVEAVIGAARERFPGREIVAVFQAHQFSRARVMLDRFAAALATADRVVLPEIYAARDSDEDRARVSASDIADAVRALGTPALFRSTLTEAAGAVDAANDRNRAVIVMGAGDVWQLAHALARRAGPPPIVASETAEERAGEERRVA